ncbi:C39 family peptidase [Lacticaseibacillus jixianensis]|uniref:C39 family peptidase n=1 Tax=Lacticaseibacillus jixianensis TaxID=2486012 RepID=A0ABW4BA00_9LACO|nr:C39 family peptidase [Lacticaseibacillus jixianensis]
MKKLYWVLIGASIFSGLWNAPTVIQADTSTNNVTQAVATPSLTYQTHVAYKGWLAPSKPGAVSGTMGEARRVEALRIKLILPSGISGGLNYQTHVQNIGWQKPVGNGQLAGTTGRSLAVQALRVNLTGAVANQYSIYYRAHVQNVGWTAYAKDGEAVGSTGMNWRIEAIQIALVKKGETAPSAPDSQSFALLAAPTINYQAHVKNVGWQGTAINGQIAGTVNRALQMEAVKAWLSDLQPGLSGTVNYRVQVQNKGWLATETNGAVEGTTGLGLRLETLQVSLAGQVGKYFDIWYQVQAQNYGWMGWTKNAKLAGTEGAGLRAEAMRIKLTPKGAPAPGNTARSYVKSTSSKSGSAKGSGWRSVGGNLKYYNAQTNSYPRQFAVKYYSQLDRRWASRRYGAHTFGQTGCGQASIAMILSGFGINVTPPMAADYSYSHGTFDTPGEVGSAQSDLTLVADHYGVSWRVMSHAGELSAYLAKGYPATVCLELGGGVRHIVVLHGYDRSGNTNVSDPWSGLLFSGRHTVAQIWSKLSWKADNRNRGASAAVVYIPR